MGELTIDDSPLSFLLAKPGRIESAEVERDGPRRIVARGGPGSGNLGHAGRPGQVGGSAPGGGEGKTQVGITSYRPGRSNREVFSEGRTFSTRLKALGGVRDVSFRPGLGIYQGKTEPTWIVGYKGNGEAARLVAETAQMADQDAVLMMFPAREGDAESVTDIAFDGPMAPQDREAVMQAMSDSGIEGGTWGKEAGRAFLRVAAVPQWGFDSPTQRAAVETLVEALNEAGYGATSHDTTAAIRVMERSGQNSYSAWLSGAQTPP